MPSELKNTITAIANVSSGRGGAEKGASGSGSGMDAARLEAAKARLAEKKRVRLARASAGLAGV